MYEQMLLLFGDIRPFLDKNEDIAPKVMDHLRVIFNNPDCLCHLKIELAVVVDVGKHFVAATYYLEGDGALLSCYERLQVVCTACQLDMMRFPNLHAVS